MAAPVNLARGLRRALDVEDLPPLEAMRPRGAIPLLNPRRLELLLTAAAYPGIHLRSAARLLVTSLDALRSHVAKLEARGILRRIVVDRRTCLFVPKLFRPSSERLLARWSDPMDRKVLEILREEGPRTRAELLGASRLRRSALDRCLRRLRSAEAVRARATPRGLEVRLTAEWRRLERDCAQGGEARLQRFLGLLAREGMRPGLDGRKEDRVRLSVDGPRSRIGFALRLNPLGRPGLG